MNKIKNARLTEASIGGFPVRIAPPWMREHLAAVSHPLPREEAILSIFRAIEANNIELGYGEDGALRPAIAKLIEAAETLLNADLGRLDGGQLWLVLDDYARQIEFSLDAGAFLDELADTGFVNQDDDVAAIVEELRA